MSSDAERKAKLKQAQKNMYELAANKFEELGLNEAGRKLGVGLRGVAKGLTSIPDFARSLINLAGMPFGKNPNLSMFSQEIEKQFDKATGNAFVPKTFGEKALGTGLEFASGAAAFNPAALNINGKTVANLANKIGFKKTGDIAEKIGGKIGQALTTQGAQQYAAAAGAGAGLELGKEIAPDSVIGQLGTSLLGGMAGAKSARGLNKSAQAISNGLSNPGELINNLYPRNILNNAGNIVGNALSVNPEKVQAFKKAGIDPTLANISDSTVLGTVENIVANTPFSSNIVKKSIENIQKKIAEYDSGISREKAGTIAQKGLKDWKKKGNFLVEKLKEKVSSQVVPDMPVELSNTMQFISEKPELYTKTLKSLSKKNISEQKFSEIQRALKESAEGKTLPYNDAVKMRESIQSLTKGTYGNPEIGDVEIGILKKLRNAMQEDISNAINTLSPKAAKDNTRYNTFYHKYADKTNKAVAPLLKNKTATKTFNDIINNTTVDAAKANTVFSTLKPEQKETFTKAIITELGSNPQNEFNSSTLATKFKKLDKEAQDIALSGFTPKEKEKFRATIDVIDAIKDTTATGNQSRTAYTNAIMGLAKDFLIDPLKVVTGLALTKIGASQLLANPTFINWVSKASNLKSPVEFEKHLSKLEILAKNSPELSSNIQEFTDKLLDSEKELQEASTWDENKEAEYQELAKLFESNPQEWNDETEAEYQELAKLFGEEQGNESNQEINNALINKIAQVESGGNPNAKAKTSTASGLLQFTNATWKDGVKKYGNELGITLRDKGDPEAQKALASKILQNNSQALENVLERPPTDGELYISHFLGLEGAKKLLQSKKNEIAAKLFPAAAKANKEIFYKNGKPITTKQLIASLESKIA